jgi:hypothetical protein
VRFEAWVPAALFTDFSGTVANRTAWLQARMREHVEAMSAPPAHHHERIRLGDRWVAGTNVGAWGCKTCEATW